MKPPVDIVDSWFRGDGPRAPSRTTVLIRGTWHDAHGRERESTLSTNRSRNRWWYSEIITAEPAYSTARATTSSIVLAQAWANAVAAKSGAPPIGITKGR